jgi:hypothetical protein
MQRRSFIKNSALAATALSFNIPKIKAQSKDKLLSAYYFRAHMYTMVPRQVREDLQWMADLGTDAICPAIIEQDLFAAVENMDIICNEAEKIGMKVFAVPSRWAGLIAGAPKVPSLFTIQNPETYSIDDNGNPYTSSVTGRISSFYHPKTVQFFKDAIDKMISLWPIAGITWDEPKVYKKLDYSEAAKQVLGNKMTRENHSKAFSDFWSDLNQHIKSNHPSISTHFFVQAKYWNEPDILKYSSQIEHLDYYGCDGRPWYLKDGGQLESEGKVLLGEEQGEVFLDLAKKNGKKSLWLIENHNMAMADAQLMDKRMPEIMERDVDHLIYYYYPRNLEDPDKIMGIMARHLKRWKY